MELRKEDTKMLQGLSVIAMLLLHLFCRYNSEELFTPIVYVGGGEPLTYLIGQLADFCVMGFAFCSGYAQYLLWTKNEANYYRGRLKSLLLLYWNFWVIILLFSVVSIAIGKSSFMPGSLRKLILTVTSVDVAYNGAWWYLFIYALITLTSPLSLKYAKKFNSVLLLVAGFLIYCVAFYVRFHMPAHGWLLEKFGTGGMTYFEWGVGVVFCKEKLFTKIYDHFIQYLPKKIRIILAMIILCFMLYVRGFWVHTLFVAPVTGLMILSIFHFWEKPKVIKQFFLFIGRHSTNIWLVHMFFFSGLFVNLVYRAKYGVLIFLFMLFLCLVSSYVINLLYKPINRWLIDKINIKAIS